MVKKVRKYYQKPNVNRVKLVINEAVLTGCKTGAGAPGQAGQNCDFAACKKSVYGS